MVADFAALSARYPGGIPETDRPRAEAALEDVEASVRHEAGLDPEDELSPVLVAITLRAARREYANPVGVVSETVGDYTWRRDGVAGTGELLTAAERAEIRRAVGRAVIVSVRTPHGWTTDDVRRITPTEIDGWTAWPNGRTGP